MYQQRACAQRALRGYRYLYSLYCRERLSEKSRTRPQCTLSGHRKGTISAHFGLHILTKSTVGALLEPLFGQSQKRNSRKLSQVTTSAEAREPTLPSTTGAARYSWMYLTAMALSPTAEATRLTEP